MCLAGAQPAPSVVWVSACPSPASGRDMTAGKVRHPHGLTSLFFSSGLGGKSIIKSKVEVWYGTWGCRMWTPAAP